MARRILAERLTPVLTFDAELAPAAIGELFDDVEVGRAPLRRS